MDASQYEMQKSRDGGGNNAYKAFTSQMEEGTFQRQYAMSNCSWLPWKWKVISAMETSMKCKKVWMEEGIMAINFYEPGGVGKLSKPNMLYGTVHNLLKNEK